MSVISPILSFLDMCEGQGNKRSGILFGAPPVIPAPCDCYDTVVVPLFLANLASSTVREIGERLFRNALKSNKLSWLNSRRLPIIRAYQEQYDKLAKMLTRRSELGVKITASEYKKEILEQKLRWAIEGDLGLEQIETTITNLKRRYLELEKKLADLKRQGHTVGGISDGALDVTDPEVIAILDEMNSNIFSTSLNKSLRIEKLKEKADLMDEIAKEEKNIKEWTETKKYLDEQDVIEEEKMKPLQEQKESIENDINKVENDIDGPAIDAKYPELAAEILKYILNALSMIDLVEKHNCQDSSMLNQSTCECSECPSGKSLCKPLLAPDIGIQLPFTEMGDELNTCQDECCGGSELKPNLSSLSSIAGIFFYPCSCQCPNIAGPGNEEQEFKPCDSDPCSSGVCAQKYPPDIDPNAFFPPPSKYEWSSSECDWVCKDGECPGSGQYRGPGCVCICKSAEDAGCFAPNIWITTSDAITGEAVSCECVAPTPTPTATEPVVTPTATEPAPTPTATEPVVTPTATEPAPTPTATEPVVTPTATEPVVTPTATEPVVTPTATEPAPTPTATEPAPTPTATEPVVTPTATEPAPTPTATSVSSCPQCSINLTCIDSGSYLAWSVQSSDASNCSSAGYQSSCISKSPNSPGSGYWGCCSQLGATATHYFDCPDCGDGNSPAYGSCATPTPTPTQPEPTPTQPTPTQPEPTPTQPEPTPTQPAPTPTQPAPTPTPTPTLCVKNCGNSNGDGYCGLPDGCGGTCRCTEPNYHCENYSCVENPCGYCRYNYSNTFQEWQFSSDNCDPGCSCPSNSYVNSNGSPSGCDGEAGCSSCDAPCQPYSNFMFVSEELIEW